MGIADMDFKVAPAITKALMERLQHENWGYLDMGGTLGKSMTEHIVGWNKKRYGIDRESRVGRDDDRRSPGHHRRAADLLAARAARCC